MLELRYWRFGGKALRFVTADGAQDKPSAEVSPGASLFLRVSA